MNPTRPAGLTPTTRSTNLKNVIKNLPRPIETGVPRQKGAPPVPQRFKIVESLGESGTCSLDLDNEALAKLAFDQLELQGSGVSRKGCCFVGTKFEKRELQQALDFTKLFTSVKIPNPDDVQTHVGAICATLVLSNELQLSRDNFVSGSAGLVDTLVHELPDLAQKSPEAAFALYSRCSARTQVAILATKQGAALVRMFENHPTNAKLRNGCARMLATAARAAIQRRDSQLLKGILSYCSLFTRAYVLEMISSRCADGLELLGMADSDLALLVLEMLPPGRDCSDDLAALRLRLTRLSDLSLPSPVGSKPQRNAGLECYERLKRGQWLTVTPSGALHLDNVPSKWDIPVQHVIELMIMEPADVMRLTQDLFAGFPDAVKRSEHSHWTTPDAIRAWCAFQEHAGELEAAGNPIAALAKEFGDKFRARLVAAWIGLDFETREKAFSTLLDKLDGRELTACREFLLASGMQVDDRLEQWFRAHVEAAFSAGSGEEGLAAMRHCGILAVALARRARKAENFIRNSLTWVAKASPDWAQRDDLLSAFLAMVEEADPQVFQSLAIVNSQDGQLVTQIHPDGQVEVVPEPGPPAERIRSLMQNRWWEIHAASLPSQNPDAAALQQMFPLGQAAISTDPQKDLMRMALPNPPAQGAWLAPLRNGAAQLTAGASSKEAAKYLQQIASALASAPKGYSPSPEVRKDLTTYLDALIQAGEWKALSACCETLRPIGENDNGQVLLAELLGKLATTEWMNPKKKIEHAANVLASFLNSGPISRDAMEQFTSRSQQILGSIQCAILWLDMDRLFAPAGKQARYEWVNAVLQLGDMAISIARQNVLRKCPAPPATNNL